MLFIQVLIIRIVLFSLSQSSNLPQTKNLMSLVTLFGGGEEEISHSMICLILGTLLLHIG